MRCFIRTRMTTAMVARERPPPTRTAATTAAAGASSPACSARRSRIRRRRRCTNAAAEALGLRCHYQLIEIAGAERDELKLLLEGVRRLGFAGINVTFPYKEAVLGLLDELSPIARRIGAVNTVVVRDGRLIGHNTDTTGFARAVGQLVTRPRRARSP